MNVDIKGFWDTKYFFMQYNNNMIYPDPCQKL